MRSRAGQFAFCLAISSALALSAQTLGLQVVPRIDLPKDSPVALISADWGGSTASARGGAMIVDLHAALSLRNSTAKRVRGITLTVVAQEVTPGGKGSLSIPCLDVGPGEAFPVRLDMRLLRPLQAGGGLPAQIGLDGVLFDDLSFYGPDHLNSRHTMTVWEMEARRDRRYYKALLEKSGPTVLQNQILAVLAREPERLQVGMEVARGPATNVEPGGHDLQFAFLRFPDSPVEPSDGIAQVAGNEAREPRMDVRNRSDRPIRYLEIGWILQDQRGRDFLAGSVPARVTLAPGQRSQVHQDAAVKFPGRPGQALSITGMTGFVNNVEFSDGAVWIPSRAEIQSAGLESILGPSPEEQRLVQIYRRKGLQALIAELKKF